MESSSSTSKDIRTCSVTDMRRNTSGQEKPLTNTSEGVAEAPGGKRKKVHHGEEEVTRRVRAKEVIGTATKGRGRKKGKRNGEYGYKIPDALQILQRTKRLPRK